MVFERRYLLVDGILFQQATVRKDTAPEGDTPSGYITEPIRDGLLPPQIKVLQT